VHLLCSHQHILTVWRGDPAVLPHIREHFVERIGEVGKSPFQATGILLQLLLGTFDHAIRSFDAQLTKCESSSTTDDQCRLRSIG
jgi:hypothetical protein